jgi:hypothetical protein
MRLTLLLLALASAPAFADETVVLPAPAALREQIAARDLELFDVLFEQCAPDKMRALVTEDIEFYHDKSGASFGADKFVGDYAGFCEERKKPDAWRSRRKRVEDTLTVDPVPGFGAIETGEHLFYERQGEGPQKLVGRAKFAQLWKLTADGWRLARVFSYAHGPAGD